MARPVQLTPLVTCLVSTAAALSLALAQAPSVAVLPVDASEAELPEADVAALREAAVDALRTTDSTAVTELPAPLDTGGAERADSAWLSRTLSPHGVSHWLVTRVRGRSRTYDVEVELWAVGSDHPVATAQESCAICGQRELRDLVRAEVETLEGSLASDPVDTDVEAPPRSLAPRGGTVGPSGPPPDHHSRDASMRIGGYATLSAGAVALVAGSTLIALDGREHSIRCRGDDESVIDADGDCRYVHRTLAGGISLLLGGVVASAGGITLLVLDARKRRRAEISMKIGNRRVAIAGRF